MKSLLPLNNFFSVSSVLPHFNSLPSRIIYKLVKIFFNHVNSAATQTAQSILSYKKKSFSDGFREVPI
jgi:hypothetical protein